MSVGAAGEGLEGPSVRSDKALLRLQEYVLLGILVVIEIQHKTFKIYDDMRLKKDVPYVIFIPLETMTVYVLFR